MMAEQKLIYKYSRMSSGVIVWLCSLRRTLVFGFPKTLGYLILQFLKTKQGQGWVLYHGKGLKSNLILVTPTSFVLLFQ